MADAKVHVERVVIRANSPERRRETDLRKLLPGKYEPMPAARTFAGHIPTPSHNVTMPHRLGGRKHDHIGRKPH